MKTEIDQNELTPGKLMAKPVQHPATPALMPVQEENHD